MKNLKVLLTAVPVALMLFSCAQEDGLIDTQAPKREVNITVGFAMESDLNSPATRPLTSIDAWQRVTDMRIYVFRSDSGEEGTFKLYAPYIKDGSGRVQKQDNLYIPQFDKNTTDQSDGIWKQPDDEQHTYSISPLLTDGYYRFLAVGYDDPLNSPVKLDWTEGVTDWETAVLRNIGATPVASEIFTGYPRDEKGEVETIHVTPDNVEFYTRIKCRRAVAGVLMYLKNIPSHYVAQDSWHGADNGTGVITSDLTAGVDYAIHEVALVTVGYNPVCNAVTRKWEDGFIYDDSRFKITRLASIELDPANAGTDGYHRDKFEATGNFVMPSETYRVKDNPLFADYQGGLLTPETRKFDRSLYLCFFTKTGTGLYYPLKLWPIKLVRSYTQDEDSEDLCAGDLMLQSNNPFNYNLVANHLYCLGMYKDDGSIDDPVDLEKEIGEHGKEELSILVVGSWQYEINIEM